MTGQGVQGKIAIEVVLAMPGRQDLVSLSVDTGSSIGEAILQSGVLELFEGFELDPEKVGIFGRKAAITDILREGDRVEIYRPLIADPKEARRQRALK